MHPYELQQHMRERGHDQVIKLRFGSLYSTIDRLTAAGLIVAQETTREGRRPERTVYAITESGVEGLTLWLRELLSEPADEYPWFGAALAFLGLMPFEDAIALFEQRASALEVEIADKEKMLEAMAEADLPRLFGVEGEYLLAMRRAELAWTQGIIDDMRNGELQWPRLELAGQRTGNESTT